MFEKTRRDRRVADDADVTMADDDGREIVAAVVVVVVVAAAAADIDAAAETMHHRIEVETIADDYSCAEVCSRQSARYVSTIFVAAESENVRKTVCETNEVSWYQHHG